MGFFGKGQKESAAADYHDTAISWEAERFLEERKSKKLAWRIAGFCMLLALASVFAVAALAPLKTVEPFVVRVDSSTGMVDIITVLTTEQTNYDEVVNRYFIAKYIKETLNNLQFQRLLFFGKSVFQKLVQM